MSASAKMNLPHVAIYYANIINIIYSLCEKLKKKNFALGSRFFWGASEEGSYESIGCHSYLLLSLSIFFAFSGCL